MVEKFRIFKVRIPEEEVAKTLKVLKQRGSSHKMIDEGRKALLPGKRISKTGKIYYESRTNRSDALGKSI